MAEFDKYDKKEEERAAETEVRIRGLERGDAIMFEHGASERRSSQLSVYDAPHKFIEGWRWQDARLNAVVNGNQTGLQIVTSATALPDCEEVSRALAFNIEGYGVETRSLRDMREELLAGIKYSEFSEDGEKRVKEWIAAAEKLWASQGWDEYQPAVMLPPNTH